MFKDIAVCVSETEGRDNTIRSAAHFAKKNKSTLTGLYIRVFDPPLLVPYGIITDEIANDAIRREQQKAAKAQESFQLITEELGCDTNWLELDDNRQALKSLVYSDLIITNQIDFDGKQGGSTRSFVNSLILETGKPVILFPNEWSEAEFGSNIVIGWDESREATRAIQDAMPLLQKAEHVEAICVNYEGESEITDVADISSFLSRRNVSNTFKLQKTDELLDTPEKVLHNFASKSGADLIVVGGYGHSRLREILLGGATRYLSKYSLVPVLFSH